MQQLSTHISRRYSELKPKDVDGNLFMYHVRQLQKAGYICKDTGAYQLSQDGKLFSSRMSLRQGAALVQPKIVVMLVCQNTHGEYLLFRWSRQPYSGLVSFPFSKVHFSRTLIQTLEEALFYKASLKGNFLYVGDIYIQTREANKTVDHMLAHIYRVTDLEGTLGGYDGLTGQPFWAMPKDIPANGHVPGFKEVSEIASSGKVGFIHEITVNRPDN